MVLPPPSSRARSLSPRPFCVTLLGLLAGLLLAVGCAGSSDPEEPSASTPAVSQGLSSAPAGPSRRAFAGPGLAWTRKLGASALDYPGPAALVASPESGLPLRLSLLPSDTPSGWCTAPGGSSAWQGAASTLRFGGDAACSPQRPDACRQAVDGLLDSGAALVALRPGRAGLELSGFQQEQLAALRLAAEARGQTLHLAASSRAELGAEGLLDSLELADLVLWEGDALELARSGRLGLANRVLRSAGRRGMLSLELSEQLPDESSLVAALGLHLATGGVAWLDAVAGAPRVERSGQH